MIRLVLAAALLILSTPADARGHHSHHHHHHHVTDEVANWFFGGYSERKVMRSAKGRSQHREAATRKSHHETRPVSATRAIPPHMTKAEFDQLWGEFKTWSELEKLYARAGVKR